jgi:co-chaperonin GroES (HSP10)
MKIIGTNILIELVEEKITNDVGIIYTNSLDKNLRYKKGIVKGVGSLVEFCKKDDTVYFDNAQSSEIRVNETKYLVVDQRGIVVVL